MYIHVRVCIIIIIIITDTQWKMIEEKENYIRNSAFLIEGACKTQRIKRPIYYLYEIGGMNGLIITIIKTDV